MVPRPRVVVLLEGCVQTGVDSHLKIANVRGYLLYSREDLSPLSSLLMRRDLGRIFSFSLVSRGGLGWGLGGEDGRMLLSDDG